MRLNIQDDGIRCRSPCCNADCLELEKFLRYICGRLNMGGKLTVFCGGLVEAAGIGGGFASYDKHTFYLAAQFLKGGLAFAGCRADGVHNCNVTELCL